MDQPPIENETEFEAHPQVLLTREGERLVVVIKATFELSAQTQQLVLSPLERARVIRHSDVPWEEPEVDSIKYPCDVTPEKVATDILGVVTAHAPNHQPVPTFDCYLRVGSYSKSVRIFGLRVWESGGAGISGGRPIDRLDVRYDYSWGGRDESNDKLVEEPRNPVGRGIAADLNQLTHVIAPQIEDPDFPIKNARTRPPPAGFGVIGRSFSPRRDQTGTLDEQWQQFRCPLPPLDENPLIHQCATPSLMAQPHLQGNEPCALLNLSPVGPLQFDLPGLDLEVEFRVKDRAPLSLKPTLNTVLLDTWVMNQGDPACVELVYCASTKAPRKLADSLTFVRERRTQ